MSATVYARGHKPNPKIFGGTFPLEAKISEQMLTDPVIGRALRRVAKRLIDQSPRGVVGVTFNHFEVCLVTEGSPK